MWLERVGEVATERRREVDRLVGCSTTITDSPVSPSGDRLGVKVGGTGGTVNWFLPDLHGSIAGSLDSAEP